MVIVSYYLPHCLPALSPGPHRLMSRIRHRILRLIHLHLLLRSPLNTLPHIHHHICLHTARRALMLTLRIHPGRSLRRLASWAHHNICLRTACRALMLKLRIHSGRSLHRVASWARISGCRYLKICYCLAGGGLGCSAACGLNW